MKTLYFFIATVFCLQVTAQPTLNIVPMPAEVMMPATPGEFNISKNTALVIADAGLEKTAVLFNDYLQNTYGFKLTISKATELNNAIVFNHGQVNNQLAGAYTMEVNNKAVYITADNETGIFYGMQTLLQILPLPKEGSIPKTDQLTIPHLSIKDYPRFAYRGMHLDVARHFFPVAFIKTYIDYLAAHKFNTFHWHLTEDQGWRIEIKKYPKLTEVGGFRNGTIIGRYPGTGNDNIRYGGFYTQEQIKEVVQYAANRYIDVIPEIELPGHSSAAIAAYPQLSCFPKEDTKILESTPWAGSRKGKQVQQTWGVFEDVFCPSEFTFNFLEDVLDEVMTLFPSKYIHIGGDECPKAAWKRSAFCQQLIKDKKLKDEHGLQSYFIQRIEKYINSKGKKIIGWDEILEGGLAPNATVMSWRGEEGGIQAARQNHDVVMTPGGWMYFDHTQSTNEDSVTIGGYTPLEKVYAYEPIPAALPAEKAKYVLGAQANLWTEYIKNEQKLEYMIFPRMTALAEVLWSPKENRDWNSFEKRLPVIFERYKLWGTNFSTAFYDLQSKVIPFGANGIAWELKAKNRKGQIIYTKDKTQSASSNYTQPIPVTGSMELNVALTDSNHTLISNWVSQSFKINKASGKKITLTNAPGKQYAGSGGFTLVDGVQNTMGMNRAAQFLGFIGKDLEAVIDLGKSEPIDEIILHAFEQTGSWIYRPVSVSFYSSENGNDFVLMQTINELDEKRNLQYICRKKTTARFIKVMAKNYGIIPSGLPGAGNAAWLFVDEIEIGVL